MAAPGHSGRERCRGDHVQAEDLAKEKAQLVVQRTTLLHLRQIHLAKAPAVRTGVTRRPATRPAASFPTVVHLRPQYRLPFLEVLLQQALEPSIRSDAVAVGMSLLSRPGWTQGVHGGRPNSRRELHPRLVFVTMSYMPLLPRPGWTRGVHVGCQNDRREAPGRLAVLYTNIQGKQVVITVSGVIIKY